MKLAIVGAGPSGFYVASRILSLLPETVRPNLRVHMYDRLWAPHGLVRYGVAPDHPEVKNCTNKFDVTATERRFRFFGNVHVGNGQSLKHTVALPLTSLAANYTHLLYATGCTLPTLHPKLPLSDHCVTALSLVHWYTRHPSNPNPPPLDKVTHVSLIGNGNVSLDIARMLLSTPSDLAHLDLPKEVLQVLGRSKVQHVSIIARRGPLEAAFTVKELRELMSLPDASMKPIDPGMLVPPPGVKPSRQQSRTLQLLGKGSVKPYQSTSKTWSLEFYRSPVRLDVQTNGFAKLHLEHTKVDAESGRAISAGETSVVPTSLVIPSLGFHAESEQPFYHSGLGHLNALNGRILGPSGLPYRNMYASGWAANGAKGVIASTMNDAFNVADLIATDAYPSVESTPEIPAPNTLFDNHPEIHLNQNPDIDELPVEVRYGIADNQIFQYPDWLAINSKEIEMGESSSKERERMDTLQALDHLARR